MPALSTVRRRRLHEQTNRHPLLDVEHVLVLAAVRGALLLLGVAVQVEQEHAREGSDQAFAHAAERGVVQVTVVGDEAKYAVAGAVDRPLREADELYVVVVQPLGVAFVQRFPVYGKVACRCIVGPEQVTAPRSLVCRVSRVRGIAEHDREPSVALGLIYGPCFARQCVHFRQPQLLVSRFERVGQVDARPCIAAEAVARFVQFEPDLQVSYGVGRHEQLVTVQAGEQVTRNVVVPEARDLGLAAPLSAPFLRERCVDHVDHFDQKGAGAGGGIEYPHEVLVRRHAIGNRHALESIHHLRPGRRIGQAISQAEFLAQQGVCGAYDIAYDRARCVENAALHALFGVVLLEKQLVEVNYRVLARVAVAEVTHHGVHVRGVDHLHHFRSAEFVEVDPGSVRAAGASADLQEGAQQVAQKRTGVHVAGEIAGGRPSRIGYAS